MDEISDTPCESAVRKEYIVQPLFGSMLDEGEIIPAKDKKTAVKEFCKIRNITYSEVIYETKRNSHIWGRVCSVIEAYKPRGKYYDSEQKRYITGRYGFYKIIP